MKKRQVTIIDVAKKAGVSIATVSNVLSKRSVPLSDDTIRRVEAAASELGYRRNVVAASLSRRRSNELGLIVPGYGSYYGYIAERLERTVIKYGYHLSVYSTSGDPEMERHHIDALLQRRVDGLFCHGLAMKPDAVREVISDGTPLVLLNAWEWPEDVALGAVNLGFADGSCDAVKHLYERGCRRFAYISRSRAKQVNGQRLVGFQRGLNSLPEPLPAVVIDVETFGSDQSWTADICRRAQESEQSLGILAFDDRHAFLCLEALKQQGVGVPGQVRLVGINNEFLSECSHPGITSLGIDYSLQAETAVRWMMAELGVTDEPIHGPEFTVPMPLVLRGSTE